MIGVVNQTFTKHPMPLTYVKGARGTDTMEPPVPILGPQRAVVAKALIRTMVGSSEASLKSPNIAHHFVDIIILCAVTIGQVDRRLMTASDIANYTKIPRATVVRRLERGMTKGVIGRGKDGHRTVYWRENVNDPKVVEFARFAIESLLKDMPHLLVSKMDTKGLTAGLSIYIPSILHDLTFL